MTVRIAPRVQRAIRSAAVRGYVPTAVWQRLHPTGTWTMHAPDGSTFLYESAPDDIMARSIVWTDMRHWEETTQPVLFDLARTARGFLDVGAFAGIYTLLACRANPQLRAVAMEPNPATVPKLRRNLELNRLGDRVTVIEKALSAEPGRGRLGIPHDTTAASLVEQAPLSTVEVAVTTADDAVGNLPIDLVKIDVEGLEPEVLRGMTRTVAAYHPKIVAECLDALALDRLRETAHELGYRTVQHLGRYGPAAVRDGFVPPPRYANFLITA